ncbi:carbohydrate ABC transporter permease [Glaciibacter psychrotolerans]|uniref:ABC-type sugar transport system permease subunit n=1 Tax=Glaciibacter psychrotolerans TaxID=670054 RepID=A0A7Z0EF84_9MICO|nr:sugar ABC transporter permease [Leifsonia psychrotolerans]NYJ20501.1 ABC-type sugar transport system permease subunit [Leifsonia psychrotolerans]
MLLSATKALPTTTAPSERPRKTRRDALRRYGPALLLVSPALVATAIFFFIPMGFSLVYSFTQYNGITDPQWVGFANYTDLFMDPLFRTAWLNTILFALITMTVGPALGLASALLLNRQIRGRGFFRAAYFIPVTISLVVVATLWKMLLNERGLLNAALATIGLPGHDWLSDPATALPAVAVASIWQGFGFETVIFLAALQTVPADLYEAAKIDGAGAWRSFLAVTLPALRPTTLFVFVVGVIGAFQVFDQVFVMTQGGPIGSTTTVVYYLVDRFRALDLGHASASAYVLVLVLGVASIVQLRLGRRA